MDLKRQHKPEDIPAWEIISQPFTPTFFFFWGGIFGASNLWRQAELKTSSFLLGGRLSCRLDLGPGVVSVENHPPRSLADECKHYTTAGGA